MPSASSSLRVVAHVDLDCFYVQVEQRRRPELRDKPTAVIQYNPWKGGACIAVGYEARKCGVKRSMRGDEARALCPEINLVQVPVAHEKADLNVYRDAGSEVVAVLSRIGRCERASIDEVYLDITEAAEGLAQEELPANFGEEARRTHIIGLAEDTNVEEWLRREDASWSDRLLSCAAVIIAKTRMEVLVETGFTCSAGIAHNKMLAKLTSGMHKPAQQTLVPSSSVEALLATVPIRKIGQLGGKFGQSLEMDLGVKTAGDLSRYSESKLQELYGENTGTWLWNAARGFSLDEVQDRTLPKSHSTGKTFPGPRALKTTDAVHYWIKELSEALQERLELDASQNKRMAQLLTIHASCKADGPPTNSKFPSRSCPLRYGSMKIAEDACNLFGRGLRACLQNSGLRSTAKWAVTSISLTASNITDKPSPITKYFGAPGCGATESEQSLKTEECRITSVQTSAEASSSHEAGTEECSKLGTSKQAEQDTSRPEDQDRRTNLTRLEELWKRKQPQKAHHPAWDYKPEEIDEAVLMELPKEIQLEVENSLRIKRLPTAPTIQGLFKRARNR